MCQISDIFCKNRTDSFGIIPANKQTNKQTNADENIIFVPKVAYITASAQQSKNKHRECYAAVWSAHPLRSTGSQSISQLTRATSLAERGHFEHLL